MSVKNISFKVVLLLLFLLGAVGGVLAFVRTIAENPPEKPQVTMDKYGDDVNDQINMLNDPEWDSLEYHYQLLMDRINLYADEGLISASKQESLMQDFIEVYVRKFNDWCNKCFNASIWNDKAQHKAMTTRIGEIRKMELANANSFNSTLDRIEGVIKDYNDAWALTKRRDWQKASSIINDKNKYSSSRPLSNCTALMDALSKLPEKLGKSHQQYVYNQIEQKLGYYNYYYVCEYKQKINEINKEIKEYENSKSLYNDYGNTVVTNLKNSCNQEKRYAENYYYREINNMSYWSSNYSSWRACFRDIWGYYP